MAVTAGSEAAVRQPVRARRGPSATVRAVRIGLAVAACLLVWFGSRGRTVTESRADITLAWLVAVAGVVAAAMPTDAGATRVRLAVPVVRPAARRWGPVVLVGVVAAAARFVALGTFPVADGDEMALTMLGRDVIEGRLRDPFTTGWMGNPTLYGFTQAGFLTVFGQHLTAARLTSALVGTLTVLALYGWGRRLFGHGVGLTAAALLALLPMHVYFSRVALNNIEDGLFLVLVLWALDRALEAGRPLDAVACGLALGLAQYFYFGARLLPLVVAAATVLAVVRTARRVTWRAAVGGAARVSAWLWFAAAVAALPLLAAYADHPGTFNARTNVVGVVGSYSRDEAARRGTSEIAVIAGNVADGLLLPFATRPAGHYRPETPLIGWPMVLPVLIGLAAVTLTWWRRRSAPIALAWWGSLVAVGLTIGVQSQRWVQALPLVALCGALGLDLLRRLAVGTLRLPGAAGRAAVVAATVAIMAAGAAFVFREANTMTVWSDPNAVVADHLAETLADAADGTVVYTAFAPRMSFVSHPTLPFLADHVVGVDLIDPLTAVSDVPDVAGPTAFVFLPERTAELDIVRAAHPGGVTTVATSRGIELYVSYWVPAG